MEFKELMAKQKEMDEHVLSVARYPLDSKQRLVSTLLGLVVEVSELANATRCFKFWSRKGSAPWKEVREEYVDVLHLFLSVGLQLGYSAEDIIEGYLEKNEINHNRQDTGY